MASPLPKITYDAPETVGAIELTNLKLDTIREVIDTMSVRLNIKLGSMASMMSDFFDLQGRGDATSDNGQASALYGINVKLGSLNMMIGEFFEEQRRRWAMGGLTENNDNQVRPPKPQPRESGKSDLNFRELKDEAQGLVSKILTALGAAFLVADFGFDKLIQESGIAAVLVKGLTKLVVVGTGMAAMFEKLGNLPVLKQVKNATMAVGRALTWFGSKVIPFWTPVTHLLKGMGKLIPFAAVVTSILDFMRGWSNTDGDMLEKMKGGLAEIAASWIGWPLNILRDIVSWVMSKFGLDTSWVDSFDFVGMVRDFAKGLFDFVHAIFTLDPSKMPEGLVNFTEWVGGLVNSTVNSVVGWIKSTFNIGDPNVEFNFAEWVIEKTMDIARFVRDIFKIDWTVVIADAKTKISGVVTDFVDGIKTRFKDIFQSILDLIPSWDDFKQSILPASWYAKDQDDASLTSKIIEIDKKIAENQDWIKRSLAGEDVYNGPDEWGRNRSLVSIEESNRLRAELEKEKNARANAKSGQAANINIINGGSSTVNNANTNVNQFSGTPGSNRPDGN